MTKESDVTDALTTRARTRAPKAGYAEDMRLINELADALDLARAETAVLYSAVENWCHKCGATSPNNKRCGRCDSAICQRINPVVLSTAPAHAEAMVKVVEAAGNLLADLDHEDAVHGPTVSIVEELRNALSRLRSGLGK